MSTSTDLLLVYDSIHTISAALQSSPYSAEPNMLSQMTGETMYTVMPMIPTCRRGGKLKKSLNHIGGKTLSHKHYFQKPDPPHPRDLRDLSYRAITHKAHDFGHHLLHLKWIKSHFGTTPLSVALNAFMIYILIF